MKHRIKYMPFLICILCFLLACGTKPSNTINPAEPSSENLSSHETIKKEVELFGTIFEMGDSWMIRQNNENDVSIYFQESKPDPVYDAMSITLASNVLKNATTWDQANQYMTLLETTLIPPLFDGEIEIKEYDKDKTPGRIITGKQDEFSKTCYLFMNNYNDCIMIIYYHNEKGTDYSSSVQEMVDSMQLAFDGFGIKQSKGISNSFTNKYGTPTTKCAHPGCSNYIASSGDTNCCPTHSNKCLNCGKYIDEDAAYCMSCLSNALGK